MNSAQLLEDLESASRSFVRGMPRLFGDLVAVLGSSNAQDLMRVREALAGLEEFRKAEENKE